MLVTGGAGFLGSHLCEQLLARGYQVLCVDNFYTGARRNIEHLLDHKHFELLRHDITYPLHVEVDEIYNLACPASRRSTISVTQSRQPKRACLVQSTCSGWPTASEPEDLSSFNQ